MNELKEHRARSIALQIVARNQVSVVADLIKHRDDLQTEIARLQPLAEIGGLAVAEAEARDAWLGWADSDSQKVAAAQCALREATNAYRETQARDGQVPVTQEKTP